MYAIIKTGGKQYKVAPGEVVKVEKLEAEAGNSVEFNDVLMVANDDDIRVGAPTLEGAQVVGEVLEQSRLKKIKILKFRRRKHHMKRMGHRQYYTAVRITDIKG